MMAVPGGAPGDWVHDDSQVDQVMNCFQAKAGQLTPQWYVIDATDMVVGRLAAQIAPILMGKHRPTYTPHIDTGDFVIVTNVEKVVFTGNKWQQKVYQRYSGYPGGQKEEAAWKLFERRPERILELAIQRMMPKSKMGRHMMSKLKLYVGSNHPHQAQSPIPLDAVSGTPSPSGAIFAPEPAPARPRRKKANMTAQPPTTEVAAKETEPALPSPPADEAALPGATTEETSPEPTDQQNPASE